MVYLCRYGDMIFRFVKLVLVFFMIINQMFDFIYNVYGYKVLNWNYDFFSFVNFQMYVDIIIVKGVLLDNCFGFIDGIIRVIVCFE